MPSYAHTIPKELTSHTLAICGDRGRQWLSDLPTRIAHLEAKWSICVLEPFPAIEFNFVAPAIGEDGENVVLKIAPPYPNHEARGEAKYLRTLDGDGVIKLLAQDRGMDAILLERAIPGKNLAEIFAGDEPSSLAPAIETLRRISRPVPDDRTDVMSLDDWFDGLRRFESKGFPAQYAGKTLDLLDNKLRHQKNYYLHGDFHPANIVSAQRYPFLAIDPKGIVGPVGYDIAVFLNNYHWWQETQLDLSERLAEAVRGFAGAFDLSEKTIRQWAFAQMVLGAWWTFDEMPEIYNNEVAKADVWNI